MFHTCFTNQHFKTPQSSHRMATTSSDEEETQKAVAENGEALNPPVQIHTLDTLFEDLGLCGRFQIVLILLGYLPLMPAVWTLLFMAYGSYNPGWMCQDEIIFNVTDSLDYPVNITLSISQDGKQSGPSYDSCDSMRFCKNGTFSDAASTIVTEWALVCDDSWKVSLIICIQLVGVLLGACAGGQVGSKLGRKFSLHGSAALLGLTNIIVVFSVSWKMYAVVDFFIGFSCGGILSTAFVYGTEFLSGWWRVFLGNFPFWSFSMSVFSLCVMALRNWQHVHVATGILSLIVVLPVFWLPESLRFLAVHGKLERANKVVRKIARLNRKPLPDTSIMRLIATQERESMKMRSSYNYIDLFQKHLWKSTVVLGLSWFILAIVHYSIGFGIKALTGNFFLNLFLYATIAIPLRPVALLIAVKLGRRITCALFLCLSAVSSFLVVAVQLLAPDEGREISTLVLALATSASTEGAWGIAVVLSVELFPTGVRNLSYGFCNIFGRFGTIVSPFLVPKEALPVFGAFLLMGVLQIICSLGILSLPELHGTPLQDNMLSQRTTRKKNRTNTQKV